MRTETFLNLALTRVRKDRPKAPEDLNFTILNDRDVSPIFRDSTSVSIGFRTRGCRYNHSGGCTMCDYWISDPITTQKMVSSVREAVEELEFDPTRVLLNVSGSFFDEWEVSREARQGILEILSTLNNAHLVFETHASTVSEERLIDCIGVLRHKRISIEMGLESANPWILKYCVNKTLDLEQLLCKLRVLKKHEIQSIVNIMVGLPFLSASEMISDAVSSVNWAFSRGVDVCVIFPMNMKPWNLVFWLEKQGLYECPPLWALVDVLLRLDEQFLPKVGLAWYRTRPQSHPGYTVPNRGPQTCPLCYHEVMELLDRFVISNDRKSIVRELSNIDCNCRRDWNAKKSLEPELPLHSRVSIIYEVMGKRILGEGWWSEHGQSVLSDGRVCGP